LKEWGQAPFSRYFWAEKPEGRSTMFRSANLTFANAFFAPGIDKETLQGALLLCPLFSKLKESDL
jgi:hypothetical protein